MLDESPRAFVLRIDCTVEFYEPVSHSPPLSSSFQTVLLNAKTLKHQKPGVYRFTVVTVTGMVTRACPHSG
jgi:hypothetical protein